MILDRFKRRYILKGKPIDSKEWEIIAEYPTKVNWIDVKEELEDQLGVEYQCFRLDECKPNGAVIRPVWTKCKRKSKKKIVLTEDDFEKFGKLHEFINKILPKAPDPTQTLVAEMERIALLKSYAEYINKVFGGNSSSDDWFLQWLLQMMARQGIPRPLMPTQAPMPQAPAPQPYNQSPATTVMPAQQMPEATNDTIVVKNEEVAKIIDEAYREVEETINSNAPCKEIGACGEENA